MFTCAPPATKTGVNCRNLASRRNHSDLVPSLFFLLSPSLSLFPSSSHPITVENIKCVGRPFQNLYFHCFLTKHHISPCSKCKTEKGKLSLTELKWSIEVRWIPLLSDLVLSSSLQGLGPENDRTHLRLWDAISTVSEIKSRGNRSLKSEIVLLGEGEETTTKTIAQCFLSYRALREKMPPVLGAVTQFHAWWHILTGLGSYLHILLR